MADVMSKAKRPLFFTLLGFFQILFGISYFKLVISSGWFLFGGDFNKNLFVGVASIVSLICGIGFLLMKKWAVYIFAVFGIMDQIYVLLRGDWNFSVLLLPAIIVYIGYRNFSKMS